MMIAVGHCEQCGSPIFGSPYADDPMANIRFTTCHCDESNGYDIFYEPDDHIIGSGDFDYHGGGY